MSAGGWSHAKIGVLVGEFRFGVNMMLGAVSALIYFIKNNF